MSKKSINASLLLAFATLAVALCSGTQAHAGAWLQPEGRGYKAAQASYFSGDVFFDASGAQQSQPRFSKIEANYYAEYGALNWLYSIQ